jgi:hypothetical protein
VSRQSGLFGCLHELMRQKNEPAEIRSQTKSSSVVGHLYFHSNDYRVLCNVLDSLQCCLKPLGAQDPLFRDRAAGWPKSLSDCLRLG